MLPGAAVSHSGMRHSGMRREGWLDDAARTEAEQRPGDNCKKKHPADDIAAFIALTALFDHLF